MAWGERAPLDAAEHDVEEGLGRIQAGPRGIARGSGPERSSGCDVPDYKAKSESLEE